MSHSKNDFPIMGGTGRQVTKPYRGSYDAFYKLINPNTKKPYTNAELAAELEHRQQEYSVLAQLISPDLEEIQKKARSHPNAEFKLARRGKSRKKAEELLHQEAYPILERIAKLLFRPLWKSNLKCGNVTVRDYVHFVGDTLYADKSLKEAASLRSCINRIILPMIGDIQLHQLSPDRQKAIVQRLNRRLKNDETISLTAKTHTQAAYRLLFQSLVQNGYPAAREGVRLSDEITRIKRQNRGIINSCRENHLDDTFRAALFSVLAPADRLYDLWLVALIYTGLAPNEIPALCFGDIDQLELRDENGETFTPQYTTMDSDTANVTLTIYQVRELPLVVDFIGTPTNFDTKSLKYSLSQDTLRVAGPARTVSALEELTVTDFDLAREFELGRDYQRLVELPAGIVSLDGVTSVTLSFDTEEMASTTLNISNIKPINVPSNYEIEVLSSLVSGVTLYGPADEIEAISADSVVAQIDCQSVNLTVGQQSIPVTIQIPSSTRVFATGSYTVQCEVVAK